MPVCIIKSSGMLAFLNVANFRKIERCYKGWTPLEEFSLTIIPEQIFVNGHKLLETAYKHSFLLDLFLSIFSLKFLNKFWILFPLSQLGANADLIYTGLLILPWKN